MPDSDVPGTLHRLIVRGIEGCYISQDEEDRQAFVERIGSLVLETGTRILAWALMDNHVHLLIISGPAGLPNLMRRLLTGYAISINRRHQRFGHLFENRYKSIVCELGPYLLKLVRYIHLDSLQGEVVKDLEGMENYAWCGRGTLTGRRRSSRRSWKRRIKDRNSDETSVFILPGTGDSSEGKRLPCGADRGKQRSSDNWRLELPRR